MFAENQRQAVDFNLLIPYKKKNIKIIVECGTARKIVVPRHKTSFESRSVSTLIELDF